MLESASADVTVALTGQSLAITAGWVTPDSEWRPVSSGGGGGGYAVGRNAKGACDRCGFVYRRNSLQELVINGALSGLLVCSECYEPDQSQRRVNEIRLREPAIRRNIRPDTPSGED